MEMLHRLKKRFASSSSEPSPPQQPGYRWCYVEQVDQAEPLANRSNGWRYVGPRGVMYRRQAVFGAGYRVRISASSHGPGYRWFNSHPVGGDPSLENFQSWARRKWRRGLVHPRDADAWKTAFIDVEGGGNKKMEHAGTNVQGTPHTFGTPTPLHPSLRHHRDFIKCRPTIKISYREESTQMTLRESTSST